MAQGSRSSSTAQLKSEKGNGVGTRTVGVASRRRRGARGFFGRLAQGVRLILVSGLVVVAAWGFVLLLGKVAYPYRLGNQVEASLQQMRADLARQKRENEELRRRIQYRKSAEGAESEARRAQFARPGEQVFMIPELKSALPSSDPSSPADAVPNSAGASPPAAIREPSPRNGDASRDAR